MRVLVNVILVDVLPRGRISRIFMSRRGHAQPLLFLGAHVVEVPDIHGPFPIVYPVPAHTVSRDIVRLIDVIRRACADRGRDGLPAGVALALDSYAHDPCRLDVCPNRRREIRAIQRLTQASQAKTSPSRLK